MEKTPIMGKKESRNTMKSDRDVLVEVAVMYYLEGKTQSEISKELFMSRPKVSRLLQNAREENIVDIKINYESESYSRIKRALTKTFGVENVIVVKTMKSEDDTITELGKAAASELKYHLHDEMTIGLSWGRTVKKTIDAFKPKTFKNIEVVELFGAVNYRDERPEMLSIGYDMSKKVNGLFYPLPAPVFIDDEQVRNALINNPMIKKTLKKSDECDLIITGLGVVNSKLPQKLWDTYVDEGAQDTIKSAGGIGYLCARFFDKNGEFIKHKINDNVIGIQTESIRKNKIFLVAGGVIKYKAMYAFLKGGYVNTIVSDDVTLKQILSYDRHLRGE